LVKTNKKKHPVKQNYLDKNKKLLDSFVCGDKPYVVAILPVNLLFLKKNKQKKKLLY